MALALRYYTRTNRNLLVRSFAKSSSRQQLVPPPSASTFPNLKPKNKTNPSSGGAISTVDRPAWPVSNRNAFFFAALNEENEGTNNKSRGEALSSLLTPKEEFDVLINDLNELKESNPGVSLEVNNTELVVRLTNKPEVALFRVVIINDKEDTLGFESPSSPGIIRSYKRNEFGEWNCVKDGHNLHGLFVRDLLPHISGMPRFASRK